MTKPPSCAPCPFYKLSTGFCPDSPAPHPKLALVGRFPGKDDLVSGAPWSGKGGRYWWREFIEPLGLTPGEVLICNVLRCYPNTHEFPIGTMKGKAVEACRQWDGALKAFNPNVWGISFNPGNLMKNPQQVKFLRRAMKRAGEYAREGQRPCLLLGQEAREKFASGLGGQEKWWQGHWWEGVYDHSGNH